jgi:hypothetical protein
MTAFTHALATLVGLALGFVLAAMLLYRDRVKPDPEDDGVHGDGAWIERRGQL